MNVLTDRPITGTEDAPDRLNREDFSKRIADLIHEAPTDSGLVIAIEGPWGYGKTSTLNLIERQFQLSRKEVPIIVRFNPWITGDHQKLLQSFLIQIAAKIGMADHAENGKKAAEELLTYSSVFTVLKIIPGVEPFATIVEWVIKSVGGAAKKISKLKELDIDGRKRAVSDALEKLNRRIVVFIDDIDRLPPFEVFEMIRLVKAVGDFPTITYILCYDSSYVETALKKHGIANSREYLNKIVQIRISLPAISKSDLVAIFNEEYERLPEEAKEAHFSDVEERIQELYSEALRFLLESPRDIKRVFNRLRVSEPACRGEVTLGDLMALEAIATKSASVFEKIRSQSDIFVGQANNETTVYDIFKSKEIEAGKKETLGKLVELEPERLRRHLRALLAALFPTMSENGEGHSEDTFRKDGRIASRAVLEIALSAGVPNNEFPFALAKEFVTEPSGRMAIAQRVEKNNQIDQFVQVLSVALDESVPVNIDGFCKDLSLIVDRRPFGQERQSEFSGIISASRVAWSSLNQLFIRIGASERTSALEVIFSNVDGHSISTLALNALRAQHGPANDRKSLPVNERWVNQIHLERLQRMWVTNALQLANKGALFTLLEFSLVLYLLAEVDSNAAREIGDIILSDDEKFDATMNTIAYAGTDSIKGRYAHIGSQKIGMLGSIEEFQAKAKRRLEDSKLPPRVKYALQSLVSGDSVYLKDGTKVRH